MKRVVDFLLLASAAYAAPTALQTRAVSANISAVCSSDGCIFGESSINVGALLSLANGTNITSVILLPGRYSQNTPTITSTNSTNSSSVLPDFSTAQHSAYPGFQISTTANNAQVALENSTQAIFYANGLFSGDAAVISGSPSASSLTAQSIYIAQDTLALVSIPKSGGSQLLALYDSTPDMTEWSFQPSQNSQIQLVEIQSTLCKQPCASSGICSTNGSCVCQSGFTGTLCDTCAPNFYGPNCAACTCGADTVCSDGITGSGQCAQNTTVATALQECNCLNGVCSGSNNCDCNAGWKDASNNGQRCSICADGFFANAQGNCEACMPGCNSCSASRCTSCAPGLAVSTSNAQACQPASFLQNGSNSQFTTCSNGAYNNNGTCALCNGVCGTCYGPDASQCLTCNSPRVLLGGLCVDVDTPTGICDKSDSTTAISQSADNAVYIVNNAKSECDAIPASCTAATIPSFSITSAFSSLECTACTAGQSLSNNGSCVKECPTGQYASGGSDSQCLECNSNCATCSDATTCTSCDLGSILANSTCISGISCPAHTFLANATCLSCAQDCLTCSDSPNNCLSCPSERPVLTAGRCLSACPYGQFYNSQSSTCQSCDENCATCFGSSPNQCLSCSAGQIMENGGCVASACWNELQPVPGFGVCLESLVTVVEASTSAKGPSKTLKIGVIVGAVLGAILLLAISFFIVRKHFRNKRKTQVQEFQDKKQIRQSSAGILLQSMKDRGRSVLVRAKSVDLKRPSISEQRHDALLQKISAPIIVRPATPTSDAGSRRSSRKSFTASSENKNPFYLDVWPSSESVASSSTNPFRRGKPPQGTTPPIPDWPLMDLQDVPLSPTSVYTAQSNMQSSRQESNRPRRPDSIFTISSPTMTGSGLKSPTYPPARSMPLFLKH